MTAAIENQYSVKVENKYAFFDDFSEDDPTDILLKLEQEKVKEKNKKTKAERKVKENKDASKPESKPDQVSTQQDTSANTGPGVAKKSRKERGNSSTEAKNQIPRFKRDDVNKENDEPHQTQTSGRGRGGFGRGGFGKPLPGPDADDSAVSGEDSTSRGGFGRGRARSDFGRGRGGFARGSESRGRGGFGRGGGSEDRERGRGGFSRGFSRGGDRGAPRGGGFGRGRGRGGFGAPAEDGAADEETDRPAVNRGGFGGPRGRGGFSFGPREDHDVDESGDQGEGEGDGARGRGRGRGRGRARGGFGRGRGREYERHSGSATTGVKPVDKRDGAGAHNWGTIKDDLEEQLAEPPAKTEDWAEAVDSEQAANAPGDTGPAMITLDEWRRQQREDRAKLDVKQSDQPSRQVDKTAFRDMTAYRKERLHETEESEEEEGEHAAHAAVSSHIVRKSDIETNFYVNVNNPQANYEDGRSARRGGGRGRGRGGPGGAPRGSRGGGRGGPRGGGAPGSQQSASFRLDEDFPELS